MRVKKRRSTTVLLFIIFFAGLSLLLYPSVSNYYNSFHQSRAIASYSDAVTNLEDNQYDQILEDARRYNERLSTRSYGSLDENESEIYKNTLNFAGSGLIGQIEIPSIDVSLPIYHTTSDRVLQNGVGHIEWTSLPIGGISSHCVLSGHRGLPSAKLFTHLDRLVAGDVFYIRVLNEVLTYEVDQILIVTPDDTSALRIERGQDFCTLLTCTPYGINTHRLLVRGHRIETEAEAEMIRITKDADQISEILIASILAVPLLILIMILILILPSGYSRINL